MITLLERPTADRSYVGPVQQIVAVPPPDTSVTIECRSATRYPASLVPAIKGVRLSPHGADATLLNISASGILVECTSRVRLGTAVTAVFDGTFSPSSVVGRVARSSVTTMDKNGVLRYHVGIAFNTPIALPPIAPVSAPPIAPLEPAEEAPQATPEAIQATPEAAPGATLETTAEVFAEVTAEAPPPPMEVLSVIPAAEPFSPSSVPVLVKNRW